MVCRIEKRRIIKTLFSEPLVVNDSCDSCIFLEDVVVVVVVVLSIDSCRKQKWENGQNIKFIRDLGWLMKI